jgi:hypothetical protein
VRTEIVEHDNVARLEGRDEELFDLGKEAFAVDRTFEQAGRVDPVVAQSGEESRRRPMTVRDLVNQPLAARRPAMEPRHIGLGPGLVDEDEAAELDAGLMLAPALAMALYVLPILFARDERLLWNGPPLLLALYVRRRLNRRDGSCE